MRTSSRWTIYFYFAITVVFLTIDVSAYSELELSLTRFNEYNDPHKGLCYPKPQSAPCPSILDKIVTDDKKNGFLGALKSRYETCKIPANGIKTSVDTLQTLFQKEYANLGSYSNNTIRNCVGGSKNSADHIAKFYFYNRQFNQGAAALASNQVVLARLLKKTTPLCPSDLFLKKAADTCEAQKECKSSATLAQLSQQVEKDMDLYKSLSEEYKSKSKSCQSNDCKVYLERLSGVLVQLNQKNPWFLHNDFFKDSKKTSEQRLTQYFTNMYNSQDKLLNEVSSAAACAHGIRNCEIKEMRTTLEKMPFKSEPFGASKTKNLLSTLMESQQCIEEGALDRDRTAKILSDTSRDAALTVFTMGLGSIPMLMKLGLAGRALTTVRVGSEVLDLSVNSYFATTEWKNAVKSCQNKELSSVKAQVANACNTETDLLFQQNKSSCMFDSSMAMLASLPMGIQFLRAKKLFQAPTVKAAKAAEVVVRTGPKSIPERVPIKDPKNVDEAVAHFVNPDLKNAQVVTSIKDTTWRSGQEAYTGVNNLGIEIMEQNGQKLFSKILYPPKDTRKLSAAQLKILEDRFLNEVAYTKKVSDLGLGPKFHGVIKGEDGKYRIVTDFVDGYEVHLGAVKDVSRIPLATVNEISRKTQALIDAGIDPRDVQFRVGKDGKAYVVDPELFAAIKPNETTFGTKRARETLNDLRWQKNSTKLDPKPFVLAKGVPESKVVFNRADDFEIAKTNGLVTSVEKVAAAPKGKTSTYNYVLLEDGKMVLGRVENEWQVGVDHTQLASGKRIVGMGEMSVNDKGAVIFNVSDKVHSTAQTKGFEKVDVQSVESKVQRYLQSRGKANVQAQPSEFVLTATRRPFYSELLSYCANKSFKSRNTNLCTQIESYSK